MPDSALFEFLEEVLVTWFCIGMFDFPVGPCLNNLDTTRAQYWACNWVLVSVTVITALASIWVFYLRQKNRLLRTVGKFLFLIPEPFMLLCDRVGFWEPLQATSSTLLSPILHPLCSCPWHSRFLICEGEQRLLSAQVRMPLRQRSGRFLHLFEQQNGEEGP